MPAEVGDRAPDFTLPTDDWENAVSLDDAVLADLDGAL